MDPVSGTTYLAALFERGKQAWELAQKLSDVELQQAVLALREEAVRLGEENVHLRSEITALREQLERREDYHFDGKVGRLHSDPDHPVCAACFGTKGAIVHVRPMRQPGRWPATMWECPACDSEYEMQE